MTTTEINEKRRERRKNNTKMATANIEIEEAVWLKCDEFAAYFANGLCIPRTTKGEWMLSMHINK